MAGILHLTLASNNLALNAASGILFIVGGIAQIFWIIPLIRRWGRPWYYVGIIGTLFLVVIWVITRMPGNPITGRGGPVNSTALIVEFSQAAFIVLLAVISMLEGRGKFIVEKSNNIKRQHDSRQISTLVGLVVVLILVASFVSTSMGLLMGLPLGQPINFSSANNAIVQTCSLTPSLIEVESTPQQIEGPYFVDERLERSDVRSDSSDGSVEGGIPLHLAINIYDIDNAGSCIPLRNAQVDIWQANSQGLYSDIAILGTEGKKFLRGYQLTDSNGTVKFTTIYPGWYEGRALHIHIKIRTFNGAEKTSEWTSQFYLDDSISDQVQSQPPYSNHGPRPFTNNQDSFYTGPSTDGMVKNNSGSQLMLHLRKVDVGGKLGYLGTFDVGLKAS
jgi:protocatechuate 3,4-dioxygenase beta subunit